MKRLRLLKILVLVILLAGVVVQPIALAGEDGIAGCPECGVDE